MSEEWNYSSKNLPECIFYTRDNLLGKESKCSVPKYIWIKSENEIVRARLIQPKSYDILAFWVTETNFYKNDQYKVSLKEAPFWINETKILEGISFLQNKEKNE